MPTCTFSHKANDAFSQRFLIARDAIEKSCTSCFNNLTEIDKEAHTKHRDKCTPKLVITCWDWSKQQVMSETCSLTLLSYEPILGIPSVSVQSCARACHG